MRGFVLTIWSSRRGPWRSAASELAVVLPVTPGSTSSNAWPARPRRAWPRHISCPTLLRALHRVPSAVRVRAYLFPLHSPVARGSVYAIESGSDFRSVPVVASLNSQLLRLGRVLGQPNRLRMIISLRPSFLRQPVSLRMSWIVPLQISPISGAIDCRNSMIQSRSKRLSMS
jgi:hypothetical protein